MSRPKGSKNKPKQEYDNRSNPLINAARGRDESGINEDELKDISKDEVLDNAEKKWGKEGRKVAGKAINTTWESKPTIHSLKQGNLNQQKPKFLSEQIEERLKNK